MKRGIRSLTGSVVRVNKSILKSQNVTKIIRGMSTSCSTKIRNNNERLFGTSIKVNDNIQNYSNLNQQQPSRITQQQQSSILFVNNSSGSGAGIGFELGLEALFGEDDDGC